jgi:hypothetical protein
MAGRDELPAINSFISNFGVDGFEHIVDTDGSLWSEFDVASQPAFAFINDDGTVEVVNGAMGLESITTKLDELITR